MAERANRTHVVTARAMILNGSCSQKLWAEAIATAVYLRNRSSSSAINNKTPYEVWNGRKPSVNHLKIFGSVAVGLNKSRISKLDVKGESFMMVGYSLNRKAYRLYDPKHKEVVEKRDVMFNEEKLVYEPQSNEVQ